MWVLGLPKLPCWRKKSYAWVGMWVLGLLKLPCWRKKSCVWGGMWVLNLLKLPCWLKKCYVWAIMSISRLSKLPCSSEKEPTKPSCQFQDCQSHHARQRRSPQSHHVNFKIVKVAMLVREGAHKAIMSISRLSKSPCSSEKEPTEPSCPFQDCQSHHARQRRSPQSHHVNFKISKSPCSVRRSTTQSEYNMSI